MEALFLRQLRVTVVVEPGTGRHRQLEHPAQDAHIAAALLYTLDATDYPEALAHALARGRAEAAIAELGKIFDFAIEERACHRLPRGGRQAALDAEALCPRLWETPALALP